MPLDLVLAWSASTAGQIETAGGRRTMQYRGATLPLVTLADAAAVKPIGPEQELAVVVFNVTAARSGCWAPCRWTWSRPRPPWTRRPCGRKGSPARPSSAGKTVCVDLHDLADAVYPQWAAERPAPAAAGASARTVLLAEDSDFFRSQVKRYLCDDGYTVLDAADGELAWQLLQANAGKVDAVVTDIEMPNLTGLGLTQRIRADGRFARLPVIGLTSLAGEDDIAKGKAAGIDDYQVKLDRDRLTAALNDMLARASA